MNTKVSAQARQTKYCYAIKNALARCGHATNSALLDELRRFFPCLSATTVHRATARLAARGEIGWAPDTKDGSMRYDANLQPHDHFVCSDCDNLRDIDIKNKLLPILGSSIADCQLSGSITISGTCKNCIK
jgi:Fur family peroxide stress response transcriptional regulator